MTSDSTLLNDAIMERDSMQKDLEVLRRDKADLESKQIKALQDKLDAIRERDSLSSWLYTIQKKNTHVEYEVMELRGANAELESKLHETNKAMQRQLTEVCEQLAVKTEENELLRTEQSNRAREIETKKKESLDRGERIVVLEEELKRRELTEDMLQQKVEVLQQRLDNAAESPVHSKHDTTSGMIRFGLAANFLSQCQINNTQVYIFNAIVT